MLEFINDLKEGWKRKNLWKELAKLELKTQFNGTVFGVLWVLLALAIKVGMISVVYSMVLNKPLKQYVLFLSFGIITWDYISKLIQSGAVSFLKAKNYLQQMYLPQSVFVFQTIYKETIVFALYQILAIPLVIIFYGSKEMNIMWLWAIPGYILIIINAVFASFWLGWLVTRYRDFQQIISSVLTISFIISPVLWPPPAGAEKSIYFQLNPFFHILEVVRAPIVRGEVPVNSYIVVAMMALTSFLICAFLFNNVRKKLILWI